MLPRDPAGSRRPTGDLLRLLVVEPRRPGRVRESSHAHWFVVATVCVGAFLGQLDASIVTVLLPEVRTDLGVSLGAAAWVSLAYLVVLVGGVAAFGRLADMVGRKLLYAYGFGLFALASLGAAAAPNLEVLVACRVVQAVGAAMLQSNSIALVTTAVPQRMLARALGFQGAAQALGLSLGPLVGTALVALGGWRLVFLCNVPLGLLGAVLGWFLLPRTTARAPRTPFDWLGLLLLAPAVASVLLGLSVASDSGLADARPVAAVALGLAFAALFVAWQRHNRAGLINLDLVRRPVVRTGLGGTVLAGLAMFGTLVAIPLWLAEARAGATGAGSGGTLLLVVLPVSVGVGAVSAGVVTEKWGSRLPTVGGASLATLGLLGAAVADGVGAAGSGTAGGLAGFAVALAAVGAGLGLFVPANNTAVMSVVRPTEAGMANGLLNMARALGTAFGVALATAAYPVGGFAAAAACLAVAAAGGAMLAAVGGRRRAYPRPVAIVTRVEPGEDRFEGRPGFDGPQAFEEDVRGLTEVVTKLRRVLRASIRTDFPWEALPMAQVELLQCLAEREGARIGEIAVALRLAPNSVSTLVQQLVEAGLVRRERDPADRRATQVLLTETGAERLDGWRSAHERRLARALGRLAASDRTAVVAALPALANLATALDDRTEPVAG